MNEQYEPFDNAEEVWFWFCASIITRGDGLRSKSNYKGKKRLCEIGDISQIIKKMKSCGDVSNRHLRVMYNWGGELNPPYYDKRAKRSEVRLWEESLQVFDMYLKQKGIL